MIYSKASYSDLDQMTEVWLASFKEFLEKFKWKVPKQVIRDVLEIYVDAGHVTVAKDDVIIGFSAWIDNVSSLWTNLKKDKLKLMKFLLTSRWRFLVPQCKIEGAHYAIEVVDPSAQGKGIGSALADLVLEQAKGSNVKKMTFFTEAGNDRITNIYLKRGFKEVKQVKSGRSKWILMEKTF